MLVELGRGLPLLIVIAIQFDYELEESARTWSWDGHVAGSEVAVDWNESHRRNGKFFLALNTLRCLVKHNSSSKTKFLSTQMKCVSCEWRRCFISKCFPPHLNQKLTYVNHGIVGENEVLLKVNTEISTKQRIPCRGNQRYYNCIGYPGWWKINKTRNGRKHRHPKVWSRSAAVQRFQVWQK